MVVISLDSEGLEGMRKAIEVRSGFCDMKDVPDATRNAMRVGAIDYEIQLNHDNNNEKETHSHLTCHSKDDEISIAL